MIPRISILPRAAALCLLFASFFGLGSVHAAGGLLLFTANGSPYVNAVVYETISSPSSHLSYITVKGGSRTQVQSQGIITNIPFPAGSNVSPDDAASIIAQTEAYATRYPQHAKLLQGVGELWRRSAEAAKLEQSRAPAVSPAATPSQSGKSFVAPGLETVIPLIRTKTGQQFKNARVTRFENDQASVSHSEGVTKVLLADISNLPAFPPDVRAAVEKVQADFQTYKKAEEERIAETNKEQERLAKIEQERLAKEAAKNEQERLAKIEEKKKSDEILAKIASLKQGDGSKEADRPPGESDVSGTANESNPLPHDVSGSQNSFDQKGPKIHGFYLGMLYTDFLQQLKAIFPEGLKQDGHRRLHMGEEVICIISWMDVNLEVLDFKNPNLEHTGPLVSVGVAGNPAKVIYIKFGYNATAKLFNIKNLSYKGFNQMFIDSYGIPRLEIVRKDGRASAYYDSLDGWGVDLEGCNDHIQAIILLTVPVHPKIDRGFGQ